MTGMIEFKEKSEKKTLILAPNSIELLEIENLL